MTDSREVSVEAAKEAVLAIFPHAKWWRRGIMESSHSSSSGIIVCGEKVLGVGDCQDAGWLDAYSRLASHTPIADDALTPPIAKVTQPTSSAGRGTMPERPSVRTVPNHGSGHSSYWDNSEAKIYADEMERLLSEAREERDAARTVTAAFDVSSAQKEAACNLQRAETAEASLRTMQEAMDRMELPTITEDETFKIMRKRLAPSMVNALMISSWKDGIEIESISLSFLDFLNVVISEKVSPILASNAQRVSPEDVARAVNEAVEKAIRMCAEAVRSERLDSHEELIDPPPMSSFDESDIGYSNAIRDAETVILSLLPPKAAKKGE